MKNLIKTLINDDNKEFIQFHSKVVTCLKDDNLFCKSDTAKGVYLVQSGKLKITINLSGEEKVIRFAGPGDIVGHRGLSGDWKFPITATSYEDTTLAFIDRNILQTIISTNPKFSYSLILFLADELRESESFRSLINTKSKIAWVLLENIKAFGVNKKTKVLNFTVPRKDIASFANTTYESVIRTLSSFAKEGIIELKKREIKVLNKKALEIYINEELSSQLKS